MENSQQPLPVIILDDRSEDGGTLALWFQVNRPETAVTTIDRVNDLAQELANTPRPAILLLDVLVPTIEDCLEALRRVAAADRPEMIYVVLMSVEHQRLVDPGLRVRWVWKRIAKPIHPDDLNRVLDQLNATAAELRNEGNEPG